MPLSWRSIGKEPREGDGGAAIAHEYGLHLGEAFLREPDLAAESRHRRAAEFSPDQIADVVAHHRAEPGGDHEGGQGHLAARSQE